MKKTSIFIIFCFLPIFTITSKNLEQRPLSEFIELNSGNDISLDKKDFSKNLIYESTRCSALYAWIASVSSELNNDKARKLEKKSTFNSKSLTGLALQTYLADTIKPITIKEANLKINNMLEDKIMKYQKDGQLLYNRNNKYISDYIKDDLEICNIMIEAYKETF